MADLTTFIKNNLSATLGFGNQISMMHLRVLDDGRVETKISADDGSVHHEAVTFTPLKELQLGDRGCFSNLKYLNQIINFGGKDPEFTFWERNDRRLISSLLFRPKARTELVYKATDPFRASIIKPGSLKIDDWPVVFALDKAALTEINEVRQVISASGEKVEFMDVVYNAGEIVIEFGNVERDNAVLRLEVPAESTTGTNASVRVAITQFIRGVTMAMDQIVDEEGNVTGENGQVYLELCDRAVRMSFNTAMASHVTTIVGRRRDDE